MKAFYDKRGWREEAQWTARRLDQLNKKTDALSYEVGREDDSSNEASDEDVIGVDGDRSSSEEVFDKDYDQDSYVNTEIKNKRSYGQRSASGNSNGPLKRKNGLALKPSSTNDEEASSSSISSVAVKHYNGTLRAERRMPRERGKEAAATVIVVDSSSGEEDVLMP